MTDQGLAPPKEAAPKGFSLPEGFFGEAWPAWRRTILLMSGLAVLALGLQAPAVRDMIGVWISSPTYNHGFLVLPASLWFVWRKRAELRGIAPRASFWGLAPLALAAVLATLGGLMGAAIFEHAAVAFSLMGVAILAAGSEFARRFWFPLAFLIFLVPFGDELTPLLQEWTADVSVWLLRASGVPTYREGIMIELPDALFEVAEACAGLRFLIAMMVVAAAFAHLSYERLWKWVVFGLLAVAVPVGANFLRAYGIMMIAHLTDGRVAAGVDHLVYGWVFFSAVMLLLLWIGGRFADLRWDASSAPTSAAPPVAPAAPQDARKTWAALGLGALLLATPTTALSITAPDRGISPPPADWAPATPAGWSAVPPAEDWTPHLQGLDRLYRFGFVKDGVQVDLVIGYYLWERPGAEAGQSTNRFEDDDVWVRSRQARAEIGGLPTRLEDLSHARIHEGRGASFASRLVTAWYWTGGEFSADARRAGLDAMKARLTGGPQEAAILALSTPYARPTDRAAALAALEAFMADFGPLDAPLEALASR